MQFLELFEDRANVEAFEPGAVLFSENGPVKILYVILAGEVELTFHGAPLGVEKQGGIVGEMALVEGGRSTLTATARTAVEAARLTLDEFRALIDRDSDFAFHAMATLANRLRAVDGFISRQLDS